LLYQAEQCLRRAALAPCWPKAVLVRLGRCTIDRLPFAVADAFLMLRRAAARCFAVAMSSSFVASVDQRMTIMAQAILPRT
jgi:hypothetical protein